MTIYHRPTLIPGKFACQIIMVISIKEPKRASYFPSTPPHPPSTLPPHFKQGHFQTQARDSGLHHKTTGSISSVYGGWVIKSTHFWRTFFAHPCNALLKDLIIHIPGTISWIILSVIFTDKFAFSQSDGMISVAYHICRWKSPTNSFMIRSQVSPPSFVPQLFWFCFLFVGKCFNIQNENKLVMSLLLFDDFEFV